MARRTVSGPHGAVTLTPMEWRLLEVLARRPGRLVTQHELLSEMPADRPHVPDSSYLRIHMMHLRQKLEADPSRPRHLDYRAGNGVSPPSLSVRMDFVRD